MRTHYDNLKVSKDAPVEVIQAAYRTLAKKYHPDINKNNPEAARIMQIINASYEVLIDPLKRT
ncbi:J domain-containing protein [Klebsiella variicola]|uniref:J domain-containing protein n=1 Tax=Klebsiella variicola TaxID=244366 RepID=UPI003C6DAC1C